MLSSILTTLLSFVVSFFAKVTTDYLAERKKQADLSQARQKEREYADIAMQGGNRKSTVDSLRNGQF